MVYEYEQYYNNTALGRKSIWHIEIFSWSMECVNQTVWNYINNKRFYIF